MADIFMYNLVSHTSTILFSIM